MWNYVKRLQYPVNIKNPNPKMAQLIISQFGGPDGLTGVCNWLENAITVEVLFSQCYIRDI